MTFQDQEITGDELERARRGAAFVLTELAKHSGKTPYQPIYSALFNQYGSRIGNLSHDLVSKHELIKWGPEEVGVLGIKGGWISEIFGSSVVMGEITEKGRDIVKSPAPVQALQEFRLF